MQKGGGAVANAKGRGEGARGRGAVTTAGKELGDLAIHEG
jgi:hypothetical protein